MNATVDKLSIKNKIDNLKNLKNNKKYYINIFNIINSEKISYTDNLNGIFFNISDISDEILIKLNIYLDSIDYSNNDTETDTTENIK